MDNQLDINGCLITLEAVEEALFRHPAVKDCVVVPGKANTGKLRLVAYLVLTGDAAYEKIEDFLKSTLPANIFPIGFIRLSRLPHTRDGQVNRKYLAQLEHLDSVQVQSLEAAVQEFPYIRQAAVLVSEKPEPPVSLHLKDYLPGLRHDSSPKIKDAFQADVQAEADDEVESSELAVIHGHELVWEDQEPRTLGEVLKRAATKHGHNGVRFIQADGSCHFQSYWSLLEEAERVLTGLRKLGLKPHDKAIFQYNSNEDFLAAFWGCTLGGIVPVPMTVPKSFARANNETETLKRVWELLDKPVVLTNQRLESSIRSLFKDFTPGIIQNLKDNQSDKNWHKSSPEDMALLLFTSGSTGKPKGVTQCHRSITAREKSTTLYNGGSHHDVSINWMPLEHVGGIVMFHLNDVYMGCQQIQVSTDYILADPLRWLDIISTYRGTITWAPNFAYALVSDRVEKKTRGNWDLSSMRFILNGGEAINAASTRKFLKLLAPFGLRADAMKPAWGMSETCSGVVYSHLFTADSDWGVHYLDKRALSSGKVKKKSSAEDAVSFVELGKPIPGTSICITDSANHVVKEGRIGHLRIKGPTVTPGYYKNPELNKEVFTADGWFDSGDLAFISNGRMTITGRAKDVIIVHGINLNSVEIEAAVEEVEGVETSFTAACALREKNSDTDKVVIFYHSTYTDFNLKLSQVKKIQKKIGEKFGLKPDFVVPVAKEDIPKTSIGKIQRLKLARLFERGTFDNIVKQVDIGLENENTLPAWFYKKTWHNYDPREYDEARRGRTCLVFEDESGLNEALDKELKKENCRCIKVIPGSEFKSTSDTCYQINYREADDYHWLIKTIRDNNFSIDDIFFLCSFGGPKSDNIINNVEMIEDIHARGVYALLFLIQALAGTSNRLRRLFVVTSDTQFIRENDPLAYEQCTIPGFLKSVSLELDWLHCCHVDLEANPVHTQAQYLIKEWKNVEKTREVAYRKGKRLQPLLCRLDMENQKKRNLPIKNGGIYLVTGGLGGIGTHVCRWLLENCAAKLVIVGRTALPERQRWREILDKKTLVSRRVQAYLDIEAAGGEFFYSAGDVADFSFLHRVIARAQTQWQDSLAGVFHLAGSLTGSGHLEYHWTVMDRHWVVKEDRQTFEEIFRPKVYGTLALHQLLKDRKEAIFVAFSSTTAFFGAATFSAYSAANGFLDGFCLYRKSHGWPNTYCMNWSSWDNVGMSENNPEPMVKAVQAKGYETILPGQGIYSMAIALRLNPQQLIIGLNSSNQHIRAVMAEGPAMNQVVNVYYTTKNRIEIHEPHLHRSIMPMISPGEMNNRILLKLYQLDEMPLLEGKLIDYKKLAETDSHFPDMDSEKEPPQTDTEQKLAKIWREILGKTHIGIQDNFFELGGHSLKATLLLSKIHKALDVKLPLVEIFKMPTIREMAQFIDKEAKDRYISIAPVEKKEYYEVSSPQKSLYIMHHMQSESTGCNMQQTFLLEGELDWNRWEYTFGQLIYRHESLRTSFITLDGQPVQKIHREMEFKIEYYDASQVKVDDYEGTGGLAPLPIESAASLISSFIRPFDLSRAPLLRVGLIKLPHTPTALRGHPSQEGREHKYLLLLDMHHIIYDGISMEIFVKEFMSLYGNKENQLPGLRLQYKDFSGWLLKKKEHETLKKQETYWLEEFEEIPALDLPFDYRGTSIKSFKGSRIPFEIDKDRTRLLKELAVAEGVTLFMVLLAVYHILLFKLGGQEDIAIGTPVAGRRHADLENIIGLFINILVLRSHPRGDKTFSQFLKEVKHRTLMAYENQDYRYEDLVDQLLPDRESGRHSLVDVVFLFQNIENLPGTISPLQIADLKLTPLENQNEFTQLPHHLVLVGSEVKGELEFFLYYKTGRFRQETIQLMIGNFKTIAAAVLDNPHIQLKNIALSHGLIDAESEVSQEGEGDFQF